jgi:hypothetical protein
MAGLVFRLIERAAQRVRCRTPDFVIGGLAKPYLRRWWVIPRNRFFNVYLHEFMRSDDDRALHDHPWLFNLTVMLGRRYYEHTIDRGGIERRTLLKYGDWKFRFGPSPHRLELEKYEHTGYEYPCWTLFITGPVVREWGFHCPKQGWIPWKRFTAKDDAGAVGNGCEG